MRINSQKEQLNERKHSQVVDALMMKVRVGSSCVQQRKAKAGRKTQRRVDAIFITRQTKDSRSHNYPSVSWLDVVIFPETNSRSCDRKKFSIVS